MKKIYIQPVFLLVIGLVISFHFNVSAQENPDNSDNSPLKIISPSPTAASLGSFGKVPVSYYTGAANVSIPLYDIQTTNHQLSINLQYSSSGLKPGDDAGWAGLGWNLNAGGVITRVIRGNDDFNGDKGYYYPEAYPPAGENGLTYDATGRDYLLDFNYFEKMVNGQKDGDPDIFYYNFAEYNGRFVMGKKVSSTIEGQKLEASRTNLDIRYDENTGNTGWIITDGKGYKYYFYQTELTDSYSAATDLKPVNEQAYESHLTLEPQPPIISSWYLTKIEAPSGETVTFEYVQSGITKSPIAYYEQDNTRLPNQPFPNPCNTIVKGKYYNYQISQQVHYPVYLNKIVFKTGYILINQNETDIYRQDLPYVDVANNSTILPRKFKKLEVFDNSNALIKKFVLDYGYFTTGLSNDAVNSRLRLEKVTEYAADGITAKPPYQLTYHNPSFAFPPKNSKAIDFWGYYNTHIENETLLPRVYRDGITYPGGNRLASDNDNDPNADALKAGILTSITYPTGGKTVFDYERNEYANIVDLSQYELTTWTYDVSQPYYSPEHPFDPDNYTSNYYPSDPQVWTIDEAESGAIARIYFTGNDFGFYGEQNLIYPDGTNCGFLESDATVYLEYWSDPDADIAVTSPTEARFYSAGYNPVSGCFSNQILMRPGKYRLSSPRYAVPYYRYVYAYIEWTGLKKVTNPYAGGVRVKSMINYDVANVATVKKYLYTNEGYSGILYNLPSHSSGVLITTPYFTSVKSIPGDIYVDHPSNDLDCTNGLEYLIRTSASIIVNGLSSNGGIVGYSTVTEVTGPNAEGGIVEYTYNNDPDLLPIIPGIPNVSYSSNGQLAQEVYKDQSLEVVKQVNYLYDVKETQNIQGVKSINFAGPQPSGHIIMPVYYYNTSQWWVLTHKEERTWFDNSATVLVTTDYFYDNTIHKQVTREETIQSDGSKLIKRYKRYPDYPNYSSNTVFNAMAAKHMVATTIEQQQLITRGSTTKLLSGSLNLFKTLTTTYGTNNPTYTHIVPDVSYKLNVQKPSADLTESSINAGALVGHSAYEPSLLFGAYDDRGNLQEYHRPYDISTSYLWGYENNAFPVAEIKNALPSQVFYESFEYNSSGVISGLARTGAKVWAGGNFSFPSSFIPVAGSKMSYWSYDGTQWVFSGVLPYAATITTAAQKLDEIRVYPADALITTYTYDPLRGMTSQTDANNVTTYYEYDSFGRMQLLRDNDRNIVKVYEYNYKQ